jgi:hypothetical protein
MLLLAMSACLHEETPKAVIRVRIEGQSAQDKYMLDTEQEVLCSSTFLSHVNSELGLAKSWGLSDDAVIQRIRKAIRVEQGAESDIFVVEAQGLDRKTAVEVLNALCSFYTAQKLSESSNGGPQKEVRVEVVRQAQ